jgi:hypothetical protein
VIDASMAYACAVDAISRSVTWIVRRRANQTTSGMTIQNREDGRFVVAGTRSPAILTSFGSVRDASILTVPTRLGRSASVHTYVDVRTT